MISAYERQQEKQRQRYRQGYERIWPKAPYSGPLESMPIGETIDLQNGWEVSRHVSHGESMLMFQPVWAGLMNKII